MSSKKTLDSATLTVLWEKDDGYDVLITSMDEKTGEKSERTDFIRRELFDSGVRLGYLKKNRRK